VNYACRIFRPDDRGSDETRALSRQVVAHVTGWAWLERVVGRQAFGAFAFCTLFHCERETLVGQTWVIFLTNLIDRTLRIIGVASLAVIAVFLIWWFWPW